MSFVKMLNLCTPSTKGRESDNVAQYNFYDITHIQFFGEVVKIQLKVDSWKLIVLNEAFPASIILYIFFY